MHTSLLIYHLFALVALGTPINSPPANVAGRNAPQIWQPRQNQRFQIILDRSVTTSNQFGPQELIPENAEIFDVDLFESSMDLIQELHKKGKKVICYFSAGASESWRPDHLSIPEKDKGEKMKDWDKEQWLDIRSPEVFEVMKQRIRMAADKRCDGIDPDNIGKQASFSIQDCTY
jgi:hypothetical protein